jgi:hypothetical protein
MTGSGDYSKDSIIDEVNLRGIRRKYQGFSVKEW